MRLINTTTYSMREFSPQEIPPYAILSHVWKGEEINFHEFPKASFTSGDTYYRSMQKIKSFCDLTAFHRIEWAWVDTCCIDKTSSAELSEAINSMFTWYAGAHVCIAFLNDVRMDINHERMGDPTIIGQMSPAVKTQFFDSEWFTRGWTLQELLAPKSVEFYDMNWQYFGSKRDLHREISEITSIRTPLLLDPSRYSKNLFPIAERMRWMGKRQTTRPEDLAYCLLGLFDVQMPLLYGEGSVKAFSRLQTMILAQSEDESIFAWSGYGQGSMLAPLPVHFLEEHVQTLSVKNREPYSMTNRGLQIRLELHQIQTNNMQSYQTDFSRERAERLKGIDFGTVIVAPLNCQVNGKPMFLLLEQATDSEDTYHRLAVGTIPMHMISLAKEEKNIFVRPREIWMDPSGPIFERRYNFEVKSRMVRLERELRIDIMNWEWLWSDPNLVPYLLFDQLALEDVFKPNPEQTSLNEFLTMIGAPAARRSSLEKEAGEIADMQRNLEPDNVLIEVRLTTHLGGTQLSQH